MKVLKGIVTRVDVLVDHGRAEGIEFRCVPMDPEHLGFILGQLFTILDSKATREIIASLEESAEILNTHLESYQVDGEVKAHLARVADLVARLARHQSKISSSSSSEPMAT